MNSIFSGFSPRVNSILQWNINGYRSKYLKLQGLIEEHNPKIIALQETKMEGKVPLRIKNYNVYRKDRTNHGGGLCIAVHKSIPSHEVTITTNLEILACKVIFNNISVLIYNFILMSMLMFQK